MKKNAHMFDGLKLHIYNVHMDFIVDVIFTLMRTRNVKKNTHTNARLLNYQNIHLIIIIMICKQYLFIILLLRIKNMCEQQKRQLR